MKRFEFRLESVLRLRQLQLESVQAKLHQLLAEEQRLNTALEKIASERRQAKAALCDHTNLESAELRTITAFLLGMDARASMFRERLRTAAHAVAEQRKIVIQADRNVRLLTKLRDKKQEEWKGEVDREVENFAQESWLRGQYLRERMARAAEQILNT